MNSHSILKHFKSGNYDYIYIYFKYKGKLIRINTDQKYLEGMHRKDLYYSAKMADYEYLNQIIMNLHKKVEQYILRKLSYVDSKRISVSQKECLHYLKTGEFDISTNEPLQQTKKLTFIAYYDQFIEYKRIELNDSPSMKDYKSLKNALLDYETTNNLKLTFDTINDKDFFNRFKNYLATKHVNGKSKGELNNNTTHKRFSSLKTFMRWIQEKEIFVFKLVLFDYKIQKYNTDFVTLDRDEIQQLQDLKIENSNWQKIIDVFICNCFMSLRFSDLSTMSKGKFLKDSDGDYYYQKRNEKTNRQIEIPITKSALKILQKYDFNLPVYTNQYFNRQLYKILVHYKLFPETIQKQELKDGEVKVSYYMKRELVTSHTCRRTFITMATNNNIGANTIMASTGHTQLSTLSKYVKANRNKQQLNIID